MATGGNTVRLTDRADTYTTKEGDAHVYALGGDDRITVEGAYFGSDLSIEVYGGGGNDRIVGLPYSSYQYLRGEDGNDYLEVGAGDGDSFANGGRGDDVLRATRAGDEGTYLYGDQGSDTLYGARLGDEVDPDDPSILNGGVGRDRLVGGDGADEFVFFTNHTAAGANRDVVRNFGSGADRIDLDGMDADKTVAGNQAFAFVGATRDPGRGEVGYYRKDGDTIVVGDDGRVSFEVELDRYAAVMDAGDFVL